MLWTELGRFGRDFDPWFDLDRVAGRLGGLASVLDARSNEFPPVNVWVSTDEAVLTTEIPGIDPKSVEIAVAGKTVSLKGARKDETTDGTTHHRRERWYGQFSKTIELPFNIEAEAVEARFRKGVLQVTLPKAQADRPRTIKVKSE